MRVEFTTTIVYGQLVLTDSGAPPVGLLWTDEEVAQDFAWDVAQVAFGIPDQDGLYLVVLDTASPQPAAVADDALWALAVPFTATSSEVEVGTILGERPVPMAPGRYQLVFQARPGEPDHAYRLKLSLSRHDAPRFAILRQGSLASATVLRTQAGLV